MLPGYELEQDRLRRACGVEQRYLVTRDGRDIVFSILTNGSGLSSGIVRRAIDEIVLAIAREVDGGSLVQAQGGGGLQ